MPGLYAESRRFSPNRYALEPEVARTAVDGIGAAALPCDVDGAIGAGGLTGLEKDCVLLLLVTLDGAEAMA